MNWNSFQIPTQVAKVLFATPPTATYQEALEHFLRAEQVTGCTHLLTNLGLLSLHFLLIFLRALGQVRAGFSVNNLLFTAKTYYALSQYADAKQWCEQTLAAQVLSLNCSMMCLACYYASLFTRHSVLGTAPDCAGRECRGQGGPRGRR